MTSTSRTPAPSRFRPGRVIAGVIVGWTLIGVVWAFQNVVGAGVQGQQLALTDALRGAMLQVAPWIPVTLAIVWISFRFPIGWPPRPARLGLHAAAALVLAYVTNVLLVSSFWGLAGRFDGFAALASNALRWTLIRLHIATLIYAAIAAVTHWVLYHRRARDRELWLARLEGQLARARLQALNAQIRPHFLFNTLHTIGQLWRSGRNEEADAVLDRLGSLFHRVQHCTSSPEVPLAEELEMVEDYLAIERARFRDRLCVDVEVDEEDADCLVPPLILQPLVENAIRHGISADSAAGRISVKAEVRGGTAYIAVSDDGPGMDAPTRSPGSGTGLRNTRERLAQLYGDAGGLEWGNGGDRGTTVVVRVPFRRLKDGTSPASHNVAAGGGSHRG